MSTEKHSVTFTVQLPLQSSSPLHLGGMAMDLTDQPEGLLPPGAPVLAVSVPTSSCSGQSAVFLREIWSNLFLLQMRKLSPRKGQDLS